MSLEKKKIPVLSKKASVNNYHENFPAVMIANRATERHLGTKER